MTMSIFKLSLTTVPVTVMLTLAGHHYVQQGRQQEATRLRAENDQLRWKISQQRRVQLEKAGVPEPPAEAGVISDTTPTEMSESRRRTAPAAEISRVPGTEYRKEGQTTPIAALQTFAWACDHGDTATMIQLIRFDDVARRKAVDYIATLPKELQTQWNSPEAMAAALVTDDGIQEPYPGAAILALAKIEVISEGRVALLLPGTNRERTEFQITADGWKYAITEKMVNDYIAENDVKAQAAR